METVYGGSPLLPRPRTSDSRSTLYSQKSSTRFNRASRPQYESFEGVKLWQLPRANRLTDEAYRLELPPSVKKVRAPEGLTVSMSVEELSIDDVEGSSSLPSPVKSTTSLNRRSRVLSNTNSPKSRRRMLQIIPRAQTPPTLGALSSSSNPNMRSETYSPGFITRPSTASEMLTEIAERQRVGTNYTYMASRVTQLKHIENKMDRNVCSLEILFFTLL